MPRQDGTGPNGQGAMTGRGLGRCEIKELVQKPYLKDIVNKTQHLDHEMKEKVMKKGL